MLPLPKPRGFWDYALMALMVTGVLSVSFWLEAGDGASWADVALAFASAILLVFGVIVVRRGENATWTKHPAWRAQPLVLLGAFALIFGSAYADAYLLHRRNITARRFWGDVVLAILMTAWMASSSRRRSHVQRLGL